jgi:hypothetical protein
VAETAAEAAEKARAADRADGTLEDRMNRMKRAQDRLAKANQDFETLGEKEQTEALLKSGGGLMDQLAAMMMAGSPKTGKTEGGEGGTDAMGLGQLDQFINSASEYVPELTKQAVDMIEKHGGEVLGEKGDGAAQLGNRLADMTSTVAKYVTSVDAEQVTRAIEGIDVAALREKGMRAVDDVDARAELITEVKNNVLDFVVKRLADLHIPPISGTQEAGPAGSGVMVDYSIKNIDLKGLKVCDAQC